MDQVFNFKLITEKIRFVRYLERKIREKSLYKKAAKVYDAIIMLGGDDFSEIYYNLPEDNLYIKNVFRNLSNLNNSGQFYMIGQTIGPYSGERLEWASNCFKEIKIYSRDDESAKYMKDEMGVDVIRSRDLAFLDLTLQNDYLAKKDEILNKYNLKENEYIVIVGTSLASIYSSDENNVYEAFLSMIKNLQNKYPNKKLVWLSHVVTRNVKKNDNTMLDKINEFSNNYLNENMTIIREEMLPVEARMILGHDYFTITCRMHAAVSTFQMGKPAICLSYSPKYKGVIGSGLDMNELVIECKNDEIWKNGITELVMDKVKYVEENYDQITAKITNNVNECKKSVSEMISEIAKNIEG